MKEITYGGLLSGILMLAACGGGGGGGSSVDAGSDAGSDASTGTPVEVTATDVKENYVRMAYGAYSDSLVTARSLRDAVDIFLAEPTEEKLSAARSAYREARIPYQQSEIMRWDTAITIDASLDETGGPTSVDDWEGQVNAWPLDENHIVSLIEGQAVINRDLLLAQNGAQDNEANVTTGVHAVEFMLWGQDTHGVDAGAGERPASDFANDGSCSDAWCERRAQYLKASIDLLVEDLEIMTAEWSQDAKETYGTLAYNFINSNIALDYIISSMRAMATDELASARMSSGLELGDPEEEHDCFSDLSHVAIYHNFQGVKNAFYGTYGSLDGAGIDALVKARDEATYESMVDALEHIEGLMLQLLEAGDRQSDPVRFDQIIGQDANGVERQIAENAVDALIALDVELHAIKELLSLIEIDTGGSSDGD